MPTIHAGVVGHPIGHSISPAIHTAALRHGGVDGTYEAFDVPPEAFGSFVEQARSDGIRGLNVTVPHKSAAFDLCAERSEDAERTGAVNVLLLGTKIAGYNTDVAGLFGALRELEIDPAGLRGLVLGAGGAGRAALWALRSVGAEVAVANRTRSKAEGLGAGVVDWADVPAAAAGVDLLVNATTIGLAEGDSPLGSDDLRAAAEGSLRTVLDVVYRPGETELVRRARAAGLRAADGLSMLVFQAVEAYELFFGETASSEAMFDAAKKAMARSERTS